MRKSVTFLLLIFFCFNLQVKADEGMWIPLLMEKFVIDDMQKKGFKLSADDIYSVNKACIKDAIVIFGRGCTGEVVSEQGLIITNHHCGFRYIQKHSSINHDYLKDGFWAMNKTEELPNPGLTVKFLEKIEDVTNKVLSDVNADLKEEKREEKIENNIQALLEKTKLGKGEKASIKPFYYGNQYFLFIYTEFSDIRLVGAPPSSIGKFGGDTDNWAWPRHTGDFSIFRIYADKNNKPADYAQGNVPYKPKKTLPVSIKGVKENDFTWVLGYPGSTQKYITSDAIKLIKDIRNPQKYELRDKRLQVMNKYMELNDTIRIKYAAKNYRVSNSWKRWKGEIIGLERLNTIEKKREQEKAFIEWAGGNKQYNTILSQLSGTYNQLENYAVAYDYFKEAIKAIEIVNFASEFDDLLKKGMDKNYYIAEVDDLKKEAKSFYKDYVQDIDAEIFKELFPLYMENVDKKFCPDFKNELKKGYDHYINSLFESSIFSKKENIFNLLNSFSEKSIEKFEKDPIYKFYQKFNTIYTNNVSPVYSALNNKTKDLYRIYVKGLSEMKKGENLFPDANFTMRVSYGKVQGSKPRDGIIYNYYTTLDGVIEKDNPSIYDYDVPDKLKQLYKDKDFGIYGVNNTVPLCFIATNHTTGGNSGSPVLDAEGNLIGVNFDRVWEGIMSDMDFDPKQSRNITLDIRYLLFIVDKFAGAGHLIDEMTIIK